MDAMIKINVPYFTSGWFKDYWLRIAFITLLYE